MEPTSLVTGTSTVLKAAELIKKMVDDAGKLPPEDAKYYGGWINVASEAIKGLEQEYIDILIQAAHCQFNEPQQRKDLLERIANYIHGENLRPYLKKAIDHLDEGKAALKQHADQWFIWPSVKKNREAALVRYDQLLNELQVYLGLLGDYGGESAVGLEDLREVQRLLEDGSSEAFMQKIDDLLTKLDKTTLMQKVGESARVIETLRIAFR
jgi:hypothetical protein